MDNVDKREAHEMREFAKAVSEVLAPDSKIKVLLITLDEDAHRMNFVGGRMRLEEACDVMMFILDSLDLLEVDELDRENMQ